MPSPRKIEDSSARPVMSLLLGSESPFAEEYSGLLEELGHSSMDKFTINKNLDTNQLLKSSLFADALFPT